MALWVLAMDLLISSGREQHGQISDGRRTGRTTITNGGIMGPKLVVTPWDLEPLCLVAAGPCRFTAGAAKAPGARPSWRLAPRHGRLLVPLLPWTRGARLSRLLARGRCSRLALPRARGARPSRLLLVGRRRGTLALVGLKEQFQPLTRGVRRSRLLARGRCRLLVPLLSRTRGVRLSRLLARGRCRRALVTAGLKRLLREVMEVSDAAPTLLVEAL